MCQYHSHCIPTVRIRVEQMLTLRVKVPPCAGRSHVRSLQVKFQCNACETRHLAAFSPPGASSIVYWNAVSCTMEMYWYLEKHTGCKTGGLVAFRSSHESADGLPQGWVCARYLQLCGAHVTGGKYSASHSEERSMKTPANGLRARRCRRRHSYDQSTQALGGSSKQHEAPTYAAANKRRRQGAMVQMNSCPQEPRCRTEAECMRLGLSP